MIKHLGLNHKKFYNISGIIYRVEGDSMFNREQPMGVLSWIGFTILMAIPFINLIMIFVFLFHPDTNYSLKNFIISIIVMFLIGFLFVFVFFVLLGQLALHVPAFMWF